MRLGRKELLECDVDTMKGSSSSFRKTEAQTCLFPVQKYRFAITEQTSGVQVESRALKCGAASPNNGGTDGAKQQGWKCGDSSNHRWIQYERLGAGYSSESRFI